MGDGIKIAKDKRHRSSGNLSEAAVEGTRSERKLEIRASIPEVDDQFAMAESRCDQLQEKLNLVRELKKKKKLKKRSLTQMSEQAVASEDAMPCIRVRTVPKKKVTQQPRVRRVEVSGNPTRSYQDPATAEQHRMLGQVRQHGMMAHAQEESKVINVSAVLKPSRMRRARADGDTGVIHHRSNQIASEVHHEVACGDDDIADDSEDDGVYVSRNDFHPPKKETRIKAPSSQQVSNPRRRRFTPRETLNKEDSFAEERPVWQAASPPQTNARQKRNEYSSSLQNRQQQQQQQNQQQNQQQQQKEERPVVELFNKNRATLQQPPAAPRRRKPAAAPRFEEQETGQLQNVMSSELDPPRSYPRRRVRRSRRYEMPTVASQMKQSGARYYYANSNKTNIPFIVSKSTSPSHNIGVNLQQVLNGLKIQQPLSGIPLTIAHHMGLRHVPYAYDPKASQTTNVLCATTVKENIERKPAYTFRDRYLISLCDEAIPLRFTLEPELDMREINVIKVGHRFVRLPSYKYMSYNRLLTLYREGDGIVPRFLKAIARPHYFYTSMYNLRSKGEELDGSTSKGHAVTGAGQETKQSLAQYATLYREYEQLEARMRRGAGGESSADQRRRDELAKELQAREEHIRRIVQDYQTSDAFEQSPLRASLSTAEEGYRHSTFKLNVADGQQG